jgi:hypothetical protein
VLVGCDVGATVGTNVDDEQELGHIFKFVNVSTAKES